MIAHIRPPNRRQSITPLIRARQMVAETLLPDEQTRPRQRIVVRNILRLGGLVLAAAIVALACYLRR